MEIGKCKEKMKNKYVEGQRGCEKREKIIRWKEKVINHSGDRGIDERKEGVRG